VYWPLAQNAPWFVLTHYPAVNDAFSWLDGADVLAFIFGATIFVGGPIYLALWLADRLAPQSNQPHVVPFGAAKQSENRAAGLHKLALGLIPAAGAGVFLGLSATTLTLLKNEGLPIYWATGARLILLSLAVLWSLRFIWRILGQRNGSFLRHLAGTGIVMAGLIPFCTAWLLFFVVW
jgi:hypothetical protein